MSELARYEFFCTDAEGNILPGAEVEVLSEAPGNPPAALYEDREGTTPLNNPFNADSTGFAAFHVAGGSYQIKVTSDEREGTMRYVAIGTAAEADKEDFMPADGGEFASTNEPLLVLRNTNNDTNDHIIREIRIGDGSSYAYQEVVYGDGDNGVEGHLTYIGSLSIRWVDTVDPAVKYNIPIDIPHWPDRIPPNWAGCRLYALDFGGELQPFYLDPDGNEIPLKGYEEIALEVITDPVAQVDFPLSRWYHDIIVVANNLTFSASLTSFGLRCLLFTEDSEQRRQMRGLVGRISSSAAANGSVDDVLMYSDASISSSAIVSATAHFHRCATEDRRKYGFAIGASHNSGVISICSAETIDPCDFVDYIRVIPTTGNITGGSIHLYGRLA